MGAGEGEEGECKKKKKEERNIRATPKTFRLIIIN